MAGGRWQVAGFWKKLELLPKTFPLKRGGLYRVGQGRADDLNFLSTLITQPPAFCPLPSALPEGRSNI